MASWDLKEIVEAVGGRLINPPEAEVQVSGVYHDTREMEKGSLFVPIIADRDGHDFLESAIAKGAATAFWSRDPKEAPNDFPLIQVKDTEKALQDFALWYLKEVGPKIVAITGSNGKTTSKDMIAAVLATKYSTHKTSGNFNNELGVPLTILSMPSDTQVLVLEMGTSQPGEIKFLSDLVQPDLAAITMIGESHIQAFGSRERLAEEKLGIISGLRRGGLLIYPEDQALITELLPERVERKMFGTKYSSKVDLFSSEIIEETEGTHFIVHDKEGQELAIWIPVPGGYNVQNALLAITIGKIFGVSLEKARIALSQLKLTKNRLEWLEGKNGIRILNDAYNASPTSMKAVLNFFSQLEAKGEKVLVLGDILELGKFSKELHEGLASSISLDDYKAVYLYGNDMKYLYNKLKNRPNIEGLYHFHGKKDALLEAIKKETKAGDLILFKSSNGTGLLGLVEQLRK